MYDEITALQEYSKLTLRVEHLLNSAYDSEQRFDGLAIHVDALPSEDGRSNASGGVSSSDR
jgi:hypothetical protein